MKGTFMVNRFHRKALTGLALSIALSISAIGMMQGLAFANEDQGSTEQQIADAVAQATPSELPLVSTEALAKHDGFKANGLVNVDIPNDLAAKCNP